MAKVLSIEIGKSLTQICEMDYHSKNPKVYKHLSLSTPAGVFEDGILDSFDEFANALHAILRKKGIRTKKVVYSVSSGKIASREIEIPFVKSNLIQELLTANASDYYPVDLTEYQIAYSILETAQEETKKYYRLSVLAVPKMLIERYRAFSRACGLELDAIDYNCNSVYQAMRRECSEGNQLLIKIDESAAMVMVLTDGIQILSRTVPYGIRDAAEAVIDSRICSDNSSYAEAVSYLRAVRCINPRIQMEEPDDGTVQEQAAEEAKLVQLRNQATRSLENMLSGIETVLDLYYSKKSAQTIERVMVTGIGGTVNGIAELLHNTLDLETQQLNELEGYRLDKVFKNGIFGEYIGCLGAVTAPVDLLAVEKKSKEGSTSDIDIGRIGKLVLIGSMVISAALLVISVPPYLRTQKTNQELESQLQKLAPVVATYQKYTLAKQAEDFLQQAYSQSQGPTAQLTSLIQEMESKMPSDLLVTSFSSDNTTVTIAINVRNKQEAADVIAQFRTFESLENITVTDVTDTASADDAGMVTFTVTGTYQGAAGEASSGASGTAGQEVNNAGTAESSAPANAASTGTD